MFQHSASHGVLLVNKASVNEQGNLLSKVYILVGKWVGSECGEKCK